MRSLVLGQAKKQNFYKMSKIDQDTEIFLAGRGEFSALKTIKETRSVHRFINRKIDNFQQGT